MKKKSILGLCLFLLCSAGIIVWWAAFTPLDAHSQEQVLFHIEKGEGNRDIAHNLQMQGLLRSGPLFRLYVLTTGVSHKLQAGDYLLSPSISMFRMVQKFTRGDAIQEKLTIIEGWNVKEINQYLASKGLTIELSSAHEGYLFPDTYYVPRSISAAELITLMKTNFEKKVGKTNLEIVIMASLLEKELQSFQDKKIAADVLWKRLRIGMALQVDAAPITYAVLGLPQNPIANPGLESIQAALWPTQSPYWYYLSTPEGPPGGEASKTIFSKTLEEHNIAKARYLK